MSKRFTDTEKWKIAWFRKLTPKLKCAWQFILDNCDHAGIWHEDMGTLSHHVGECVDVSEIEAAFKGKIYRFDNDKFFINAFIEFQYGKLKPENRVHRSVISKLEKYGIYYKGLMNSSEGLLEGPAEGIKDKDKEKDMDMDKDKAKDKDKEKYSPIDFKPDAIISLFNSKLAGVGRIQSCPSFFIPGGVVEDFQNMMGFPEFQNLKKWEEYFEIVASSKFLTSKGMATIPWLLKSENAFKVMSGQFQDHDKNEPDKDFLARMKELELKYDGEVSA